MGRKPLPIGVDDFEKLITRGYYFIDKTLFIKELLDQKGDVNLFTRPGRFGKSLNISMLRYFFEDGRNLAGEGVDNTALFEGLEIMRCGDTYLQHMGRYPVIMLSLKSARQPDFGQAYAALKDEIAGEFYRHSFVLDSDLLTGSMKEKFTAIRDAKAERQEYNTALRFLSECLAICCGRKAIILVDEYDVPLESAHVRGYYGEMVDFIRSLFESALKTNPNLEFAVVTGCLRISKESVFTGMNNLKMISILNKNYDEYFGFTSQEVRRLCEDYDMPEKYDMMRIWYDGYVFGGASVYNPWSIIQYTSDLLADIHEFPSSYWANTSSNTVIRRLIDMADRGVKDEIELLIEGKTVEKPVHEDITYDEVYDTMENLWNFMFFTGYFKKAGERLDERTKQRYLVLEIPNEEVRYIFRTKVLGWFHEQVRERDRTRLFRAFLQLDADTVREEIEAMLYRTISFNDAYESFYHGFLAGILYGMEDYATKSNREGGKGRTDLFIKPVSRRRTAYVVEFKVAKKCGELGTKAGEALRQIEDRFYARELWDDGYESVACYGIAFCGKDCEVKIRDGQFLKKGVEDMFF